MQDTRKPNFTSLAARPRNRRPDWAVKMALLLLAVEFPIFFWFSIHSYSLRMRLPDSDSRTGETMRTCLRSKFSSSATLASEYASILITACKTSSNVLGCWSKTLIRRERSPKLLRNASFPIHSYSSPLCPGNYSISA